MKQVPHPYTTLCRQLERQVPRFRWFAMGFQAAPVLSWGGMFRAANEAKHSEAVPPVPSQEEPVPVGQKEPVPGLGGFKTPTTGTGPGRPLVLGLLQPQRRHSVEASQVQEEPLGIISAPPVPSDD
jgi:hypothetical protein